MPHKRITRIASPILPLPALVACGILLLATGPAGAQLRRTSDCQLVFGVGELHVETWIDDPPEPFVVAGEFQVAIDDPLTLVTYLDDEPEKLTWYDAVLTLVAFPGSDAPLPGGLSWAPCSSSWELERDGRFFASFDSFCESTLVPDPDEGADVYEMFVREEIAVLEKYGRELNCGRLHLEGLWDAGAAEPSASDVTVSGKLCRCER